MSVFKIPHNEMNQHQRNRSELDIAVRSLDRAQIELEDHMFHAIEGRARIKMLRERIVRLEAEYAALPAPAEQISWLRKVVAYVRDAFSSSPSDQPAQNAFHIVGASAVTDCHYCKHIQTADWVACSEQEYIELQADPLYDLFKGPFGVAPPPAAQPMLYKPKDCASNGGGWALCSNTFYLANQKNGELDFVEASD